jgi:putative hydrolase of the HAD superfamily
VLTDVPYGMPKKLVMKDLEAIKDKINLVITSADVGYRKPSTTGLERILKHFNLSKDETIYIGNEQKDILMANNFGIYSVLICSENTAPSWGQQKTITKLKEIELLLRII